MPGRDRSASPLQDRPLPVRARLAACWTSFLFLYVYVDILNLYLPGVIDDILAGVVWEFDITQAWAVGALTLVSVPVLMVALSATLPARVNRVVNLVVAVVYVPISAGNIAGETWTAFFGLGIALELGLLALIVRLAWRWPRIATSPRAEVPVPDAGARGRAVVS